MAYQNKNYFQRRTRPKGPRINDRIRAYEVQVISSDKQNLGTFPIKEAIDMAKAKVSGQAKAVASYKNSLKKKQNQILKRFPGNLRLPGPKNVPQLTLGNW